MLWYYAQAHCHAIGGHLVAFETPEEYFNISAQIPNGINYYIGLNDMKTEGKYVWEHSGEELGYDQFWRSGEPQGYNHEDCVIMRSGTWTDVKCDKQYHSSYFFCEFE